MLTKKVQDALNKQINAELYSSYLYLSMQAHFEQTNLPGFANWMKVQSKEEYGHAMKIYDFINDRTGKVELSSIQQPTAKFKSPLEVIQLAYEHEQSVSGMIYRLYDLAVKENDFPTQVMLQWFITEQVEEEKQALQIVEQLKMIGDNTLALLMLDKQLGERK
ncbi:MAG: ferritin [candidate division Zixibacteria bacterium RBG_16_50_21]|nr:MAG: ferritin [candidate division Zixibacteria bacterium RBG_16_50_21]